MGEENEFCQTDNYLEQTKFNMSVISSWVNPGRKSPWCLASNRSLATLTLHCSFSGMGVYSRESMSVDSIWLIEGFLQSNMICLKFDPVIVLELYWQMLNMFFTILFGPSRTCFLKFRNVLMSMNFKWGCSVIGSMRYLWQSLGTLYIILTDMLKVFSSSIMGNQKMTCCRWNSVNTWYRDWQNWIPVEFHYFSWYTWYVSVQDL